MNWKNYRKTALKTETIELIMAARTPMATSEIINKKR